MAVFSFPQAFFVSSVFLATSSGHSALAWQPLPHRSLVRTAARPGTISTRTGWALDTTLRSNKKRSNVVRTGHPTNHHRKCDTENDSQLRLFLAATTHQEEYGDDETTSSPLSSNPAVILQLFNSKTRQKEALIPVIPGQISMYTCGPTVYDCAHVGNFRAFLTYDVLKRVLEYYGYIVTHVCNLTDVDDKIIQRATEQGLANVLELTRTYERLFFQDLQALNIRPATHYPRATEHIPQMMELILILRDKGLAYETSDGSWYFRTQAQPKYGTQLVQLNFDDMEATSESRNAEEGKEHFADFCLWKAFKEGIDREDAAWSSAEIRKGRPGWHLECSAMARTFFGADATIDLHGGGIDLKFPHHENEIAQSEGASNNKVFCNCWFHNGFVNIGNEKMSKSLGNFLTLRTACPSSEDVRAYRYLVISSQYRNPLAFTPQAMEAAKNAIARIDKIRSRIQATLQQPQQQSSLSAAASSDHSSSSSGVITSDIAEKQVPAALASFEAALQDDLSMPRAAAALFSLVKVAEQEFKKFAAAAKNDDTTTATYQLDLVGLQAVETAMNQMDQVFGIFYTVPTTLEQQQQQQQDNATTKNYNSVPEEVLQLVSERTAAKDAKDWALADSLRTRITELGFTVKDVKGGGGEPIVSRIL